MLDLKDPTIQLPSMPFDRQLCWCARVQAEMVSRRLPKKTAHRSP